MAPLERNRKKKKGSCFPGKRCNSHSVWRLRIKLVIPGRGFSSCFLFSQGCATIPSPGLWRATRAQRGSGCDPCAFPAQPRSPRPLALLLLRARGHNSSSATPRATGKHPLTAQHGGPASEKFGKDVGNNQRGWRKGTIKPG